MINSEARKHINYIPAKHIVTNTKSPSYWFGTEYNMNIYKGCCHGCIYCDSRSKCYQIEDFDHVRAKENALQIIRDDLRRKRKTGVVATGAMSDPYNPFEQELELTRHALELCDAFGFGVAIATKSSLLARDTDVLQSIGQHSPVLCKITITAIDDDLAGKTEPYAATSSQRFETIHQLSRAGIYTGILLMPVLPFLNDTPENILGIVGKAHECGAKFIYPGFGMTLRDGQREWYYNSLDRLFPEQRLSMKYTKRYGNKYQCSSPQARKLWQLFTAECEKRGILYQMKDIIHSYKRPYQSDQLNLFDYI